MAVLLLFPMLDSLGSWGHLSPMDLYILRHGIAVERGLEGITRDSDRPLTSEGIKKTRQIANNLKALKLQFDVILTSPYLRARQTADLVAEAMDVPKCVHECQPLLPGGSPGDIVAEIKRRGKDNDRVLLVGHEPDLTTFASFLLTGGRDCAIDLRKAGLIKLTASPLSAGRCATLHWLVPPKLLLRMGR